MENNNLENNIKRSFEEYDYNLDHNEIWDNIEPKLKRKKKRRFMFLWFFGGLAMLSLLYTYSYTNKDQRVEVVKATNEAKTNQLDTDKLAVDAPRLQNDNAGLLTQEQVKLENKSAHQVSLSSSETVTNTPQAVKANQNVVSWSTEVSGRVNEKWVKDVPQNLNAGVELFKTETKKSNLPIQASTENKVLEAKDVIEEPVNFSEESDEAAIDYTQGAVRETDTPNKDNQKNASSARVEKQKMSKNEVQREKIKREKIRKEKIKQDKLRREKIKKAKLKKEQERKKKLQQQRVAVRSSKRKHKWSIQPTLGAVVPLNILSSNSLFPESAYLNQRKESETQLEAYSLGFNLSAQMRGGLIFTTGLELQRLESRYDFENTRVEQEVSSGIISVTENAAGERIDAQYGPKEKIITTTEMGRFFNSHTFVNVPLGMGKVWNKRKYDFRFMAGVDINLYHHFTGRISGPDGDDIDFRGSRTFIFDQVYKRKTGLGIWAATEFHKHINDRLNLSIAPRIQLPLSKITQDAYELNQRFIKFNLTLGANYFLNPPKKKTKK